MATYLELFTSAVLIPVTFYTNMKPNKFDRTHDILQLVKHSIQLLLRLKHSTIYFYILLLQQSGKSLF